MFPTKALFVALAAALCLAGCGGRPSGGDSPADPAAADSVYLTPPAVTSVTRQGAGLLVSGQATAGATVRLARPGGGAATVAADAEGRWAMSLPPAAEPAIFGLSMVRAGRQVQAQGYLLTTPGGAAAVLRSGAGAIRVDPQPTAHIGAVDFDRDGDAVVSGTAPPGAALSVQLDDRQALDGQADAAGRYSLALPKLAPGPHRIEVLGDGFDHAVSVDIAPPAPLVGGPLRSQLSPAGLRADWLTPGGGVQSTVLTG